MTNQCINQPEPQQVGGYDIQVYDSPKDYRSLYFYKELYNFVLVFQGKRTTGKLTEEDHTKLINILKDESRKAMMDKSVLESDSINYPYLSIKERSEQNASNGSDFFVLLPLNSKEKVITEISDLVDYIFIKYGQ